MDTIHTQPLIAVPYHREGRTCSSVPGLTLISLMITPPDAPSTAIGLVAVNHN